MITEAERENPDVRASLRTWHAETEVVPQVSALPDPQVTIQHMAIGSPLPFSHFTTSNFAYIGAAFSQPFPWPGTLALRRQAATQASDAAHAKVDVVRRRVRADLKAAYAQLGAVQETLALLERDGDLLAQMERIAEARYRVGQGSQQEVLRAQLEQTTLQRDLALQQEQRDRLEAHLKRLLGRAQASPLIIAQPPAKTPLPDTRTPLAQQVVSNNPALRGQQRAIAEQHTRVALARKGFRPDFAAQVMWQHTAAGFPDYYMFTLEVRVPLYWRHRQVPALAEAADRLSAARTTYTALLESDQAELSDALTRARTADRLLTIYQHGLIPQARAAFDAGLAAYQTGQLDFESLLGSFRDVLDLDSGYWQALADHEVAVARIEEVTGVDLP
ncbi:MAG TPA: TolC family protein [Vicinamibacterales bacterium]|nr:TolC family protein [Vicinamibacterales bacterium]